MGAYPAAYSAPTNPPCWCRGHVRIVPPSLDSDQGAGVGEAERAAPREHHRLFRVRVRSRENEEKKEGPARDAHAGRETCPRRDAWNASGSAAAYIATQIITGK